MQTIIVINTLALTMTQGCIHIFKKRDNFKSEYFECIKCFRKHIHNKDCVSLCQYRGAVCKLTGFKIYDVQTNYYDEQPCPYVRTICPKLKIEDYVGALLLNMTPNDKKEEYKEDNQNIRKILSIIMSSKEHQMQENMRKQPAVIALMIVLNYYNRLVAKEGTTKNEERINLIKRVKKGCRKKEYTIKLIKVGKTSEKIINHRKIWKLFSELRSQYDKICREI